MPGLLNSSLRWRSSLPALRNGCGSLRHGCRYESALLRGDEFVRRGDPGLRGKNLFGQNAVNLLIGIEAGVLENDTAEIQVKGASQRGENNPARRDTEKNEVLDAAGPKDQLKMIIRKRPHSLLVDHQVLRMKNIAVKFHGGSALDEKIVLFDPQKRGFKIRNLRVPLGKPKPHMYDAVLILPRKRDRFRGPGHHAFGP